MEDLRFGVIGWGYWGPKIARNLDSLPHAVITMVADSDAHRLTSLAVNQYQSWVRKTTQAEDVFRSDVVRKLIQSGDLGKIYCIEAERVNLGLFRSDINVIWDLAPHDISILLYLLGKKPERIKVQAHAHLQPHIHDIAHLDLGFADGMTAHIHVSWLHPRKIRRVTVIGDRRMVVYDDTKPAEMIKIYNKGADVHADPGVSYRNGEITIPYINWVEPLRLECEDFANAIRTGTQPRAHGGIGLEVVRVLAAAQEVLEKDERQHATAYIRHAT